ERGSEGAARQILGTLRRGGALGMLIDQDTKVDGVWVPFFGRPAFTPVGAAKIALRQRARVIAVFIERLPDGSPLARAVPPLDLPADPREATARMTAVVEEQIRRRPEQWAWMHRLGRRQPPAAASSASARHTLRVRASRPPTTAPDPCRPGAPAPDRCRLPAHGRPAVRGLG